MSTTCPNNRVTECFDANSVFCYQGKCLEITKFCHLNENRCQSTFQHCIQCGPRIGLCVSSSDPDYNLNCDGSAPTVTGLPATTTTAAVFPEFPTSLFNSMWSSFLAQPTGSRTLPSSVPSTSSNSDSTPTALIAGIVVGVILLVGAFVGYNVMSKKSKAKTDIPLQYNNPTPMPSVSSNATLLPGYMPHQQSGSVQSYQKPGLAPQMASMSFVSSRYQRVFTELPPHLNPGSILPNGPGTLYILRKRP
ncbi:hypothetical protein EDD86DRAFT_96438 [Gorgonomyces haynaldii]|nr:hypothetical protein EDD86DRAFT_96438 [Gorgonomyces haynaldii]